MLVDLLRLSAHLPSPGFSPPRGSGQDYPAAASLLYVRPGGRSSTPRAAGGRGLLRLAAAFLSVEAIAGDGAKFDAIALPRWDGVGFAAVFEGAAGTKTIVTPNS